MVKASYVNPLGLVMIFDLIEFMGKKCFIIYSFYLAICVEYKQGRIQNDNEKSNTAVSGKSKYFLGYKINLLMEKKGQAEHQVFYNDNTGSFSSKLWQKLVLMKNQTNKKQIVIFDTVFSDQVIYVFVVIVKSIGFLKCG